MAPRPRSSANHNTTPLHLPSATPLQPTTTTTTNSFDDVNTNNKRPLTAQNDAEFFETGQRASPSDRGFPIEAQIQHGTYGQQQQQQGQDQDQDWSLIDFQLGAQQLQAGQPFALQYGNFQDGTGLLPFDPAAVHDLPLQDGRQQLSAELLALSQLLQPQQHLPELAPVSQPLQYNNPCAGLYGACSPTSPGAVHHQSVLQQPTHQVFPAPPPPPPPPPPPSRALNPVPPPPRPQQPPLPPVRQSVYTNRSCSRPVMTSTTAAAALSKPSATVATSFAAAAASSSSSTYALRHHHQHEQQQQPQQPPPPASLNSMRIGGFALEEAGITLPADLAPDERQRRLCLLAQELRHEALHPPILPPSRVPELPAKPPPFVMPTATADMTPAERDFVSSEIRRLGAAQKKLDQERNNLAAKKSRMLRLECLENTRLQLNAKAAECAWLRLQLVALTGTTTAAPGRHHAPSQAWGGSDYVYRRWRKRGNVVADDDGEGDEDDDDVEGVDVYAETGVVPRRIKLGITEEVRARVEAHKTSLEEAQKRRTSDSRAAHAHEAKAARELQTRAGADAGRKWPRRRGSRGSSKR